MAFLNAHIGIYFAACMLLTGSFTLNNDIKEKVEDTQYFSIRGKVETSGYYCGGAPPPRRVIENAKRIRPYVDYKIYVIEGKRNKRGAVIIDSTMTNVDGHFRLNLLPGEYVLLSSDQIDRELIKMCLNNEDIEITDFDCLEEWWQKGLRRLVVKDMPQNDVNFHIQKQCFLPAGVPCLHYVGAMPP